MPAHLYTRLCVHLHIHMTAVLQNGATALHVGATVDHQAAARPSRLCQACLLVILLSLAEPVSSCHLVSPMMWQADSKLQGLNRSSRHAFPRWM